MADDRTTSPPTAERRTAARNRAENHFAASERRDSEVRKEIENQRAATIAQMAKLRALRLAKEEAERIEAANAPAPKARKPRTIKVS